MTEFIPNAKIKYAGRDYITKELKVTCTPHEGRLEFTLPGKIEQAKDGDDVVVTFKAKATKPKYLDGKKSTSFVIDF